MKLTGVGRYKVEGGGRWRYSGTKSISFWLRYRYVKGVKAERVKLGLEIFFTGSRKAMNVRAFGPRIKCSHFKIRTLHLESCKSSPRSHSKSELTLGSKPWAPHCVWLFHNQN